MTEALMPAARRRWSATRRFAGGGADGSSEREIAGSTEPMLKNTRTSTRSEILASTSTSRTMSVPFVMSTSGSGRSENASRQARVSR
jgi:hypothetical protein